MKVKEVLKQAVLDAALRRDRERVVKLIDELGHDTACRTVTTRFCCCNCGLDVLKMAVESGRENYP